MFPILSMWLHLIAVITWIGGTLFLWLVLSPSLKRWLSPPRDVEFLNLVRGRFKTVRWVSLVTLVVTGLLNLLYEGGSARLESTWGGILMVKLLFVAIVMGLVAVNDFILSPGTDVTSTAPLSRPKTWLEGVILVLSLFIVFIAVYLRQF